MTKETISETAALKALLSETADHQILAGMLGFVADRLMALDVDFRLTGTSFDAYNRRFRTMVSKAASLLLLTPEP